MKTAKNPEKKRFRLFSYLFNTRMGTMIFSIITAIFLWFAISINLYPTTPRTISHSLDGGYCGNGSGTQWIQCD